jgi:hypothetical protein
VIDDHLQTGEPPRRPYVPPHLRHCEGPFITGEAACRRPEYPGGVVESTVPKKPLTYLASPYSHPSPEMMHTRFELVTKAAAWLILYMKWNVFCPITHSHPLATLGELRGDWPFWKKIDTEYLSVSERLVVLELDGWRTSTGVQAEIEIARKNGIEIHYMRPNASHSGRYDLAPYPMDEIIKTDVKSAYGNPIYLHQREPSSCDTEVDATKIWQQPISETKVTSKATTANPKDIVGSTKISLSKVPCVAIAHEAHAMMDGARKYDPYNWRAKAVQASIYVDAALRHIHDWFEGEELAPDSKVHHLGHARACLGILLDCQENNRLIDDRPITEDSKGVATRVFDRLRKAIAEMPPVDRAKL